MQERLGQLDGLLAAFAARRRFSGAWNGVLTGACLAATVFFCYLTADHALGLPPPAHYFFCAAFWLGIGAGAWRLGGALFRRESRAALALRMERLQPSPRNHLVNAVQLAESAGAPERAAEQVLRELPEEAWADVCATRPGLGAHGRRLAWLLTGYAALAAVLLALAPGRTLDTLRCLARPTPAMMSRHHTVILNVLPGDVTLKPGGDLRLIVRTGGPVPAQAVVELDCPNRSGETAALERAAGDADAVRWQGIIPKLFNPCRYRVAAGNCTSRWYKVAMAAPPALADWSVVVTPPAYTGAPAWVVRREHAAEEGGRRILLGSRLQFEGAADSALRLVSAQAGGRALPGESHASGKKFKTGSTAAATGPLALSLTGLSGVQATHDLPFAVAEDAVPTVAATTALKVRTPPLGEVAVGFAAADDAGLHRIGIEQVDANGRTLRLLQALDTAPAGRTPPLRASGKFVLNVAKLGIAPGRSAAVRLFAEDGHPDGARHRGVSAVVEISTESSQALAAERKQAGAEADRSLSALVRLQQDNAAATAKLVSTGDGGAIANGPIRALAEAQAEVRKLALGLMQDGSALTGGMAATLARLAEGEMPLATGLLEKAAVATGAVRLTALDGSLSAQRRILAALTGLKDGMTAEIRQQARQELMGLLRQLVKRQEENLGATRKLAAAPASPKNASGFRALAKVEDRIAEGLTGFDDAAAESLRASAAADDGFPAALREARRVLEEKKTYESMVRAAEALDAAKAEPASRGQADALRDLLAVLDILNRWNVKHAKEEVHNAAEKLKELDAALKEMEAQQAKIKAATDELARDGKKMDDPGVKETLRAMDKQQEPMAELAEKLAQDLYQFPELPVANELNGKMREVFEDVQQAKDSEHAPAIEIAVQKEDALLDAIRETKKRVEDVEMWLPDVPDNIVWNMESFDTDEIPNIPLVPLPDELEDIVGELLKQDPAIAAQSQDTTGNNIIADTEMGWGIMDGPMPSFSAKGKSGNMAPNDNEMTGRSGAGREGKSTGELVENKVKGLEGRQTDARYTKDPLQKGQVTEDESSTLKARSTGGGKLGGESESAGMFGKAPRRDLGVADHGGSMTQLRQEVEAQYTRARLLYVEGGRLGEAARELRGAEEAKSPPDYGSLCRRVVQQLRDGRFEQASGAVLPMATESAESATAGSASWDFDINAVRDPAYRETIRDYYRGLQQPPEDAGNK